MSLQPINSPTTWKRAQTSINANFTALVNALAGEGTVDATDPAVTALLTDNGSGAYAAVEGIVEDVADGVVEGLVTSPSATRTALDAVIDARTYSGNRPVGQGEYVLNARTQYDLAYDGITDDSTKLQQAIDAVGSLGGGTVFLPPGIVRASGLELRDGVRLIGAGKSRTLIINAANDAAIEAIGDSGTRFSGCEVSDLSIEGTNGTASQMGIRFHYVDNGFIGRCRISNMGNNGINYHWSENGRIVDNDIHDCDSFGILFFNSNRLLVAGNFVHDLTSAGEQHFGIQSKSSQLSQVVNNRVRNIAGYGLYAFSDGTMDDYGHVFSGNIVTDMVSGGSMSAIGIYVSVATDVRVVNNLVQTTASNGIGTSNASRVLIAGNRVNDSATVGISVGTGSLNRVSQNTITDIGLAGIYLNATTKTRVTDNTISNLTNASSGLNALLSLRSTAADNTVTGNDCYDSVQRGIYEEGTASGNAYGFNRVANTTGNAIALLGTGPINRGNIIDGVWTP